LFEAVEETLSQLREWPDSLPWAQNEQSPRVSEDYCQTCYAAWVMQASWPMLIFDKASEQLVGTVGFQHIDGDTRTWELGYWCRLSLQGQGRMTEAVKTFAASVGSAHPQVQLRSRVDVRNTGSIKVLERSGFSCFQETKQVGDSGQEHLIRHYAWGRVLQTGQSA
jgi:hypothetical protein